MAFMKGYFMPGMIRTNKKAMKIAYNVLNTPKCFRQDKKHKPSEKKIKMWRADSFLYR